MDKLYISLLLMTLLLISSCSKKPGETPLMNTSTQRQDQNAPSIVFFETEEFIPENDGQGRKLIYSSTSKEPIVFVKFIHHWKEEPRFLDIATQKYISNLPHFKIKVEDSDSNDSDMTLYFKLVRIGNTPWETEWKRAEPIYDQTHFHSQIILSEESVGTHICLGGEESYELWLEAQDKNGHASRISKIPFKINNLKQSIFVAPDLNFQSKPDRNDNSIWVLNRKGIFTPRGIKKQTEDVAVKRFKIASAESVLPIFLKVKAKMEVMYHFKTYSMDASTQNPRVLSVFEKSFNKLKSKMIFSIQDAERRIEPLAETSFDQNSETASFEYELKPQETIFITVSSNFDYKQEGALDQINQTQDNLAYHVLEVEPFFEITALPVELNRSNQEQNGFKTQYRDRSSFVYAQNF